jgi:hypothetical protein
MTIPAAIVAFLFLGMVTISRILATSREYQMCTVEKSPNSPVAALLHFVFSLEEYMNVVKITSSLNPAEAELTELVECIFVASFANEPTRTLRSPEHLAADDKSGNTS